MAFEKHKYFSRNVDTHSFLCPETSDLLSIGGDYYSEEFSYVQIEFKGCQLADCAPENEVDGHNLKLFTINKYVDFERYDKSEVIKAAAEGSVWDEINSNNHVSTDLMFTRSEIELKDSQSLLG